MSDIAIRVENLGKMYRIGAADQKPQSRWQAAKQTIFSPFEYLQRMRRPPTEEETLWALRDVSFEVKRGEVLGLIGRNGAGKSTLLKILSRITDPTHGRAQMHGRVGSLLEVGTGFHPELTGRENVYLSGTILGMKKAEIDRKFDEIVDFSGVEKFIDTPVKRYSSGMNVRLGFAVAAHLEPEILLIDEVLAVGDAAFQKKCLGKMEDVAKEGRTVLFVSHNMGAVSSLCARSILLSNGKLSLDNVTDEVVSSYLMEGTTESLGEICLLNHPNRPTIHQQLLTQISLSGGNGNTVYHGDPLTITLGYDFPQTIATPQFVISFHTTSGVRVFTLISDYQTNNVPGSVKGRGEISCIIKSLPLLPGAYLIGLRLWQPGEKLDEIDNLMSIQVEWLDREVGQFNWNSGMGMVYVDADWLLESSSIIEQPNQIVDSSGKVVF